ncbi:hypothetical protein D9M72_345890 [compost metagenome]
MIQDEITKLGIPNVTIGGSIPERLEGIAAHYNLPRVMSIDEAIRRAQEEYDALDVRNEKDRELAGSH